VRKSIGSSPREIIEKEHESRPTLQGKLAVITRPRGGDWLDDEVSAGAGPVWMLVVSLLEGDEAVNLELRHERRRQIQGRSVHLIPDSGSRSATSQKTLSSLLGEIAAKLEKAGTSRFTVVRVWGVPD